MWWLILRVWPLNLTWWLCLALATGLGFAGFSERVFDLFVFLGTLSMIWRTVPVGMVIARLLLSIPLIQRICR
jgi:hypothetical protein